VWAAASSITFVTSPGWEISDRCEALISVTVACARRAMNSCAAGGIAWSDVPITAQLGMLVQAGGPDTSASAEAAIGRWVAASSAAWLAGRSLARMPRNSEGLMYTSVTPPGDGTKFRAAGVIWLPGNCEVRLLRVSPWAGM